MSEPLSDEYLATIRERVEQVRGKTFLSIATVEGSAQLGEANRLRRERERLLDEVDRLRAAIAELTTRFNEGRRLVDRLAEDLDDHRPLAHDWLVEEANSWCDEQVKRYGPPYEPNPDWNTKG